ncbi:hypothetical protein D9757_006851 [Collybiopsis confluens]|uniref:Uncharacterized protein n=1 Tax=Collybiopsis confluens TaxID=2823264 RepID=A0A8H5MAZ2_9AGAR|nr:hypothetical protein D9757_006851 [Collybiopsis confluens]
MDTLIRSSFFAHSNNFTIYGGTFKAEHHNYHSDEHQRCQNDDSDLQELPEVTPEHLGGNGRTLRGKSFEDPGISYSLARESLQKGPMDLQYWRGGTERESTSRHSKDLGQNRSGNDPHLLRIIGKSPTSSNPDNDPYYILSPEEYTLPNRIGIKTRRAEGDNEDRSMESRLQFCFDVTFLLVSLHTQPQAGLDFLSTFRPNRWLADLEIENFDVFSDDDGKTMLALTPQWAPQIGFEENGGSSDFVQAPWSRGHHGATDVEVTKDDIRVFNALISKLFNDANHIIYREWREKVGCNDEDQIDEPATWKLDLDDGNSLLQSSSLTSVPPTNVENFLCRREIAWRCLSGMNPVSSISNILEIYDAIIPRLLSTSPIDFPRRPERRRLTVEHRCKGYRREEITFTADAFHNAILVFRAPSLNEICSLCGQVVSQGSCFSGQQSAKSQGQAEVEEAEKLQKEKEPIILYLII